VLINAEVALNDEVREYALDVVRLKLELCPLLAKSPSTAKQL